MKISFSWLKQYANISLSADETASILTACGLEVESAEKFESIRGGLKGIVVGEVKTKAKHPNADKLSLTTVDIGNNTILNIVCGAPNVEAGQKVLVATNGATLYPLKGEPFEIKKSKIRGEESNGMICAEDEIGLGASHEGILILKPEAVPGTPAAEYFHVTEDVIFEIGLTPNRVDAASHIGVARDLIAALNAAKGTSAKVIFPELKPLPQKNAGSVTQVQIEDPVACPRYSGINISGVKVAESPDWLRNRLISIGLKPINNIVDVGNFVMQECGLPLHMFDADSIQGNKVIVKKLSEGTSFTTLDGTIRKLSADDLVICNSTAPMCLAGVFGGLHSGVKPETKNIFIESAYFSPAGIRRTSKRHALKTDAAFRYERGADPEMLLYALKRATQLILEIAGGTVSSDIIDIYPQPVPPSRISFSLQRFESLSGIKQDSTILRKILADLDIQVLSEKNGVWDLEIPAYRPDVKREADVTEEILRIIGYDKIPVSTRLRAPLISNSDNLQEKLKNAIASFLCSHGFYEIISNSLSRESQADEHSVKLSNPLSDELSVMRRTLLFSGLQALAYNKNRKANDLMFFEYGKTYDLYSGKFVETNRLSLLLTGNKYAEAWNAGKEKSDFFFLKACLDTILKSCGVKTKMEMKTCSSEYLASSAECIVSGKCFAIAGEVASSALKAADLSGPVYFAELNWDVLMSLLPSADLVYTEVPKFPEVRRDLSMIIDKSIAYAEIEKLAFRSDSKLLKSVNLFDVYEGDKIENGKKSLALSFYLSDPSRTLTDTEIEKVMGKLSDQFEKNLGAHIRRS